MWYCLFVASAIGFTPPLALRLLGVPGHWHAFNVQLPLLVAEQCLLIIVDALGLSTVPRSWQKAWFWFGGLIFLACQQSYQLAHLIKKTITMPGPQAALSR